MYLIDLQTTSTNNAKSIVKINYSGTHIFIEYTPEMKDTSLIRTLSMVPASLTSQGLTRETKSQPHRDTYNYH